MTQPVSRDSWPVALVGPPPPPPLTLAVGAAPLDSDSLPDPGAPNVSRLTPTIVGVAGGTTAASRIGRGLDAFLQSATPTFRTDEGPVTVSLGFHMQNGAVPGRCKEPLDQVLAELHITGRDRQALLEGKASPALVTQATQGLIDAGCLPATDHSGSVELANRVRELMASYGLGIDCAAYVIGAVASSRGVSPAAAGFDIQGDGLYTPGAHGYARLPPDASLQPGDILCLHGATGRPTEEHRAVVRNVHAPTPSQLEAAVALAKGAGAHAGDSWERLDVDSSWGNFENPQEGGVSRQTWFHDRTSGTWISSAHGVLLVGNVPYAHDSLEIYRPGGNAR
jgi:hypothetical protein